MAERTCATEPAYMWHQGWLIDCEGGGAGHASWMQHGTGYGGGAYALPGRRYSVASGHGVGGGNGYGFGFGIARGHTGTGE
jgi:hypothetical protein